MPKRDIRMTPDEVHAFLATRGRATVVAGGDGEAPHGALARFSFEAGRAIFRVAAGSKAASACSPA